MNNILKFILFLALILSNLNAAPARGGLLTFTQPDGTTFKGYLKGDAAFHWIESNSKVVMYNSNDKNYYYGILNTDGKLVLSKERPDNKIVNKNKNAISFNSQNIQVDTLDKKTRRALSKLQYQSRQGSHPR